MYGVRPDADPRFGLKVTWNDEGLPGLYADKAAALKAIELVKAGEGTGGRPYLDDIRDRVLGCEGRLIEVGDIPID